MTNLPTTTGNISAQRTDAGATEAATGKNDVIDLREGAAPLDHLQLQDGRSGGRPGPLRAACTAHFTRANLTISIDLAALVSPALLLHQPYDLLTALTALMLFSSGDLYRPRLKISVLDELPPVIGRLGAAVGAIATLSAFQALPVTPRHLLTYAPAAAASLAVGRLLTGHLVRLARRRGLVSHTTIIIGSGLVADAIVNSLLGSRDYGLAPVGSVADDLSPEPGATRRIPHLGAISQLADVLKATGASIMVVSSEGFVEASLLEVIRKASSIRCEMFVVPRLLSAELRVTDHIGAIPLMRTSMQRPARVRRALKRLFDIGLSTVALVMSLPVMVACAIAAAAESGTPVLFKQLRVGGDGKPFTLYKFRSLRPLTEDEDQTKWSISDDSRVGPVGRFLRRFGLDELPQLWNILRGDMTFVGPRPERPFFVEQFVGSFPEYRHRLRVRPGLTGLAQVSGLRGDTSIEDRARYDNYYIDQWSLWLDFKVILRTVAEVLRGGGR